MFSSTAWIPLSWSFFSFSYGIQWDLSRAKHWLYPLNLSNQPRFEELGQVQSSSHVGFEMQLPPTHSIHPEKRMPIEFVIPQFRWVTWCSFSVCLWPFPFHACARSMLRNILHWDHFFHSGRDIGNAVSGYFWSISWWNWNHLCMPTWVTLWGCLRSGGSSASEVLYIIWSFCLSSAIWFVPGETPWSPFFLPNLYPLPLIRLTNSKNSTTVSYRR